jgi:hypothetical protein
MIYSTDSPGTQPTHTENKNSGSVVHEEREDI